MARSSYTTKVPDPKSKPRRHERVRRAAQDWVPDPIHTSSNFWAQHSSKLFSALVLFLVAAPLVVLLAWAIWNEPSSKKELTGTMIGLALCFVAMFVSGALPLKWWLDHQRLYPKSASSDASDAPLVVYEEQVVFDGLEDPQEGIQVAQAEVDRLLSQSKQR